jgi:hypothetical protein
MDLWESCLALLGGATSDEAVKFFVANLLRRSARTNAMPPPTRLYRAPVTDFLSLPRSVKLHWGILDMGTRGMLLEKTWQQLLGLAGGGAAVAMQRPVVKQVRTS